MQTTLDVQERVMLLDTGILPAQGTANAQGSYQDWQLAEAIRKAIGFTDDEKREWGVQNEGGAWRWLTRKPLEPDAPAPAIGEEDVREMVDLDLRRRFTFGDRALALIQRGLERINARSELRPEQVPIYLKFVVEPRRAAGGIAEAELAAECEVMPPAPEPVEAIA